MTNNYFSIERNDQCYVPVYLVDNDGHIAFTDLMEMSFDEMKSCDGVEEFVVCAMDAADELCGSAETETTVTLIGADGVFVWSIIINADEDDDSFNYLFVDWRKDGKTFRYVEE